MLGSVAGPTWGPGVEERLPWWVVDDSEFSVLEGELSLGTR